MANIKSQIKRNRSNEKRRLRNQGVRSELKTRTKTATTAIETGADDAPEAVRLARAADRAVSTGLAPGERTRSWDFSAAAGTR